MVGRTVTLQPLDRARHAPALFDACRDAPGSLFTYLSFGPFTTVDEVGAVINAQNSAPGWQPYAIVVDGTVLGFASYLRIDPANGTIEIGSILFSPRLQRTTAATEALYLMIRNAFGLGYRRCEWKCDDLNAPSRAAALRLGFRYEGTFVNATHYKGRSRDTAWYAITDDRWPALDDSYRAWLATDNFDADGNQRRPLAAPAQTLAVRE